MITLSWTDAPITQTRSILKQKQRESLMAKNDDTYSELKSHNLKPENERIETYDNNLAKYHEI